MNRSAAPVPVWPLLLLAFSYVFLNTAWVAEDAFITFRSVDQLLAGNGPVWNLGERVQVYTHPLWYGLLSLGTALGLEPFWLALLLSYLALLGLLALLGAWARREGLDGRWLLGLALALTLSRAFIDYSSSGLENPLLHLLLLATVAVAGSSAPLARRFSGATLLYGLIFLTRPDGIVLLTPLLLWLWAQMLWTRQPWLKSTLLALLPVIGWELFSLIYYGSLVPNTALAKVNIDYPAHILHGQARRYFIQMLHHDPLSLLLLAAGLLGGLLQGLRRRQSLSLLLALGLLLQLAYLFRVGADYMLGRFLSASVLQALLILLLLAREWRWPAVPNGKRFALGALLLALLLSPNYRLGLNYVNLEVNEGFADERGYYYPRFGLLPVWLKKGGDYRYLLYQLQGRRAAPPLTLAYNVGMRVWLLPLDRPVIDLMALTEPFLARLPAREGARVGHYERALPPGYLLSRLEGENRLQSKELAALYDDVWLATRSPELFSRARWAAIWRLNSGHYRHLEVFFKRNDINAHDVGLDGPAFRALDARRGGICPDPTAPLKIL